MYVHKWINARTDRQQDSIHMEKWLWDFKKSPMSLLSCSWNFLEHEGLQLFKHACLLKHFYATWANPRPHSLPPAPTLPLALLLITIYN